MLLLSLALKSDMVFMKQGHEAGTAVNVNSDHDDRILFDVCCILTCNLWAKPTSRVEVYIAQLNAFKKVNIAQWHGSVQGIYSRRRN